MGLLLTRCSLTVVLRQQLIQTWGFRGGYTHNWNPYWNTSIYGAFAAVMYNDTSEVLICGLGGVGGAVRGCLCSRSDDHLQPGLQHRADWFDYPVDPGQEPDLLGGSYLHHLDQK